MAYLRLMENELDDIESEYCFFKGSDSEEPLGLDPDAWYFEPDCRDDDTKPQGPFVTCEDAIEAAKKLRV